MAKKNWKERIIARRKASLLARGEKFAQTQAENDAWLKEASERGGIVVINNKDI